MPCRSPGHTQREVEGSGWGGGISRPIPRGKLRGLAISRPTPRGEVEGSGWGVSRPTPGGSSGPHLGGVCPGRYEQQAGSTHPTGMHSCFNGQALMSLLSGWVVLHNSKS